MPLRRLASVFSIVCLLFAAAGMMAQSVAAHAKHVQQSLELSVVLDHGHSHEANLDEHDPGDHTHDSVHPLQQAVLPLVNWTASWASHGTPVVVSMPPGGQERPPRAITTL